MPEDEPKKSLDVVDNDFDTFVWRRDNIEHLVDTYLKMGSMLRRGEGVNVLEHVGHIMDLLYKYKDTDEEIREIFKMYTMEEFRTLHRLQNEAFEKEGVTLKNYAKTIGKPIKDISAKDHDGYQEFLKNSNFQEICSNIKKQFQKDYDIKWITED